MVHYLKSETFLLEIKFFDFSDFNACNILDDLVYIKSVRLSIKYKDSAKMSVCK